MRLAPIPVCIPLSLTSMHAPFSQGNLDPGFKGQIIDLRGNQATRCPDGNNLCPPDVWARKVHRCSFSSESTEVDSASSYQAELAQVRCASAPHLSGQNEKVSTKHKKGIIMANLTIFLFPMTPCFYLSCFLNSAVSQSIWRWLSLGLQ